MARVLFVDDDALVRNFASELLRGAGFEVLPVEGGKEALQALRLHAPDLVICDLFMPEMDGLELIQKLRQQHPEVKVIAISGGGQSGMLDMLPAAKVMGAAEVLNKPFSATRLLDTVRRLLPPSGQEPPGGQLT